MYKLKTLLYMVLYETKPAIESLTFQAKRYQG